MAYDRKHVGIKQPKEGYNTVAEEYGKYHTHLDWFDKWSFLRFIPRVSHPLDIIDLGAGDWRLFKFFEVKQYRRYVACDIAEKLLARHPGTKNIEKVVCDLEAPLPFEHESFDLAMAFFVLEHINNIQKLFSEIYRILRPGGRCIIGHFMQRHEFTWANWRAPFKIDFVPHRFQDLVKIAEDCFFAVDIFPVEEKKDVIGHILVLEKN